MYCILTGKILLIISLINRKIKQVLSPRDGNSRSENYEGWFVSGTCRPTLVAPFSTCVTMKEDRLTRRGIALSENNRAIGDFQDGNGDKV